VAEELNVAWAMHEITADFMAQVRGRGRGRG